MFKLKQKYIDLIKDKEGLRGAIADAIDKHSSTILRWAENSSPYLTLPDVLNAISEYTGDPILELTEKVELVK